MVRFTRRRGARSGGAILAVVLLVAGPFAAPAQAQAQDGQQHTTLRVALVQQIDHLNPFTASFASSAMIGRLSWEFLTLPSAEDASPTGGVAEKWTTSPDKLTWTFTIREGMKWSDGQPVTAQDAAFTFNRIMNDPAAAEANGSYVTNFESVTAPDEQTLVVKTKKPQASITAIDIPIVPEHIWKDVDDMSDPKTDTTDLVGVGNGPFLITDYEPNEVIKLKANPDYWRGPAKIDELQFVKYEDANAAVSAMRNGEVDLVNRLTPAQFDALKDADDITTNKAEGRRYNDLMLNPGARNADRQPIGDGHPALQDVRVRKAIARSVNPQTIVDKVVGGYGQLPGGIVPAVYEDDHWSPNQQQAYTYDPGVAGRALDEAGYRQGQDGIRVGPDGRRLEFRIIGRASEDFDQRVADYVVGWLGDIGVQGNKQLVSDNEVDEKTSAGNYDLAISGWGANPDPDYILGKHACESLPASSGSSSTASFFCDPEFDRLYNQQAAEMDPAARSEIVKQAQARLHDQAPTVVLDYDNALEAYRSDKFSSFTKQPTDDGPIMEQTGYWGFYGATPADEAAGGGSGLPAGAWVAIGAGVVVVVVGGGVLNNRRKKSIEDRE